MRKYLRNITVGAALLLLAGSCTDKFEEYNTNQYQIHDAVHTAKTPHGVRCFCCALLRLALGFHSDQTKETTDRTKGGTLHERRCCHCRRGPCRYLYGAGTAAPRLPGKDRHDRAGAGH